MPRIVTILALLLLSLFGPETALAQMTSARSTGSSPSMSRTDPASSPAFLDRNDPARFARYAPSFCDEISGRSDAFAGAERTKTWHDRWPQTVITRQTDSAYSAAARQVAIAEMRACLEPFILASATPYQMWALGKAWLTVGDEAKANEAFTGFLKSQARASVEERAWWLQQLVSVYSGTGPSGLRTARAYLARLDSLGDRALGFRIAARNSLYNLALGVDDIPLMREQATAARALSFSLSGDHQREWMRAILDAVANLADVDFREGKVAVAKDSLENGMKMYEPIDPFLVPTILGEPLMVAGAVAIGTLAPAPKATFIYYPGRSAPEKTLRDSLTGKPTLYVRLMSTRLIGPSDFSLYALVARVREQFGDRVNIVLIGTTSGTYAHRLVKDSVEAEQMRIFAHEYLHLAAPLTVFSTEVINKDEYGRVIRSSNPTELRPIVLADKRGVIRDLMTRVAPVRTINMIAELLEQ